MGDFFTHNSITSPKGLAELWFSPYNRNVSEQMENLLQGLAFLKKTMVARQAFVDACLYTGDLNRGGRLWDYAIDHNRLDLIPSVSTGDYREGWRQWSKFMARLTPEERATVNRFLTAPVRAESGWEVIPVYGVFTQGFFDGFVLRKGKLRFFFAHRSWLEIAQAAALFSLVHNAPTRLDWLAVLRLRVWLVVCGIHLFRLAAREGKEDYARKGDSLLRLGISFEDVDAIEEALAHLEHHGGAPNPEDFQGQVKLLQRFRDVVPGLREFLEALQGFLSLLPGVLQEERLPVILVGEELETPETIAQMCLWAYRQTREEAYCRYLLGYVRSVLKKEEVTDVVAHLLEHWRTPVSQYSFQSYIKKLDHHISEEPPKEEIPVEEVHEMPKKFHREHTFPLPLKEAVTYLLEETQIPLKHKALYQRLLRAILAGKLPALTESFEQLTPEGLLVRKQRHFLTKEQLQEAKRLLLETEFKGLIVQRYMELRKVGRRAAERFLQRRLQAGKSLKEIWEELGRGDHGKARKP